MRVIAKPRCKGKTTQLLYASDVTKVPIVVMNNTMKKNLLEESERLGLNIPEPITVLSDNFERELSEYREVYVDDAEHILNALLGGRVSVITISKEDNRR